MTPSADLSDRELRERAYNYALEARQGVLLLEQRLDLAAERQKDFERSMFEKLHAIEEGLTYLRLTNRSVRPKLDSLSQEADTTDRNLILASKDLEHVMGRVHDLEAELREKDKALAEEEREKKKEKRAARMTIRIGIILAIVSTGISFAMGHVVGHSSAPVEIPHVGH